MTGNVFIAGLFYKFSLLLVCSFLRRVCCFFYRFVGTLLFLLHLLLIFICHVFHLGNFFLNFRINY
ncbi:hypothetical protein DR996_24650 [Vibrio owensii]|nr:hypothetical protein DR996_24650 [Vibrio owensii]